MLYAPLQNVRKFKKSMVMYIADVGYYMRGKIGVRKAFYVKTWSWHKHLVLRNHYLSGFY